jgi:hypothetical protein
LEIRVDSPAPEEVINVTTIARKCVTVNIPISNPKDSPIEFAVILSDESLFGEKKFVVPANAIEDYRLIVSPLKAVKQNSSVIFFSDEDGEFWYSLKIEATEAPPNTLAPISSPLGKYASTWVDLENPLEKLITFRVENDNPTAFHVVCKRVIQFSALEKRRIEVRYIPTNLGTKETAILVFKSNEIGDWIFHLSGTGKAPPQLSPVLISSTLELTNSALVLFSNPFSYPSRFSISLTSDKPDVFKLLIRRRLFTVNSFGEEFQIPFTFTPRSIGQFSGHIVVGFLGPARGPLPELNALPSINWVYPIIGSCVVTGTVEAKLIKCKAHEDFEEDLSFSLIGEQEIFEVSDYVVNISMPSGYDFVMSIIDVKTISLKKQEASSDLIVHVMFKPQRPFKITAQMIVKNPVGQDWDFEIAILVEPGKVMGNIIIESLLHKTGTASVTIPCLIRSLIAFHAYFAQGVGR